jgi:hypothetical protein
VVAVKFVVLLNEPSYSFMPPAKELNEENNRIRPAIIARSGDLESIPIARETKDRNIKIKKRVEVIMLQSPSTFS